ncbi:MAG: FeoA family protein [Thermoleophilia bacterium]|jgi:Fe2+ transport system protein FeoA
MAEKLASTNIVMNYEILRSLRGRRRRQRRRRDSGDWCQGERGCVAISETPLAQVPAGNLVEVTQLLGDEVFRNRTMAMGIVPGATLSVVSGGSGRPLVLALSGSRLLLDAKSSEAILVQGHELRATTRAGRHERGVKA